MFSLVIPIYKNAESLPDLVDALKHVDSEIGGELEAVFVVDGSPDASFAFLERELPRLPFRARLLGHSRNFGSFAAIRTGLKAGTGPYFGVMAADLQEPPELVVEFCKRLRADGCDVVLGRRISRADPLLTQLSSGLFWRLYRRLVISDMPHGGVDIFGCNQLFRDEVIRFEEARTSLLGLIFWLGFRRDYVAYERRPRKHGRSAWSWRKKIDYMTDSVFAFTDLPLRVLMMIGVLGTAASALAGIVTLIAYLAGLISVPGYTATLLAVLFFGTLNIFGLAIVGSYAWRAYENTKRRPLAVVSRHLQNREHADVRDHSPVG